MNIENTILTIDGLKKISSLKKTDNIKFFFDYNFPDYDYWASIAAATSSSSATACCIAISGQRRTARILKYLTPARVLYLLTTRASLWPYGQTTSQSSRSSRNSGLCSIKPKIKEYSDKMMIEWLVSADFLRKMKRVHIYFTPLITSAASSIA